MELRWVLYGYRKEQFRYYVQPEEAQIVRRIFEEYLRGDTLLTIAKKLTAEQVPYFGDRCVWSKNAVSRVLENSHYIGDEEYPAIIDKASYDQAMKIRMSKSGVRKKDSKENAYIKSVAVCECCGGTFGRRSKHRTRERWYCSNGCSYTTQYIDDAIFIAKIQSCIGFIIQEPYRIMCESECKPYEPTREIIAKERNIKQLINAEKPMFQPIKKLIFESVTEKYSVMEHDLSKSVTDTLYAYLSEYKPKKIKLDIPFMKTVVSKIIVQQDGNIRIKLVNGKEISSVEVAENESNARTKEACDENSGEKGTDNSHSAG